MPRRVQPSHGTGQKMDRGRRPFPDRLFWLRFGSFTATPPPCQHFSPSFYGTCLLRSAPQPPRRLTSPPPVCLAVCRSHLFSFRCKFTCCFPHPQQGPEVTKHIYVEDEGARPSSAGRLPSASWNPTVASPFPGGSGVPDGRKLNTTPGA